MNKLKRITQKDLENFTQENFIVCCTSKSQNCLLQFEVPRLNILAEMKRLHIKDVEVLTNVMNKISLKFF
jgi:hypothetical protein